MNIWLPIVTNLIIVLGLVIGTIIGKNAGWKVQLSKLILILGSCVGIYYLAPMITKSLLKVEEIKLLCSEIVGLELAFNSIVFLMLYMFIYSVITIIVNSINKHCIDNKRGINVAKRIRMKGIDRNTTRELRREERKVKKLARKEAIRNRRKINKIISAILAFIITFISLFIVSIPLKYISEGIANTNSELTDITKGYEYTIYGQIDNLTNISDIINNIGE